MVWASRMVRNKHRMVLLLKFLVAKFLTPRKGMRIRRDVIKELAPFYQKRKGVSGRRRRLEYLKSYGPGEALPYRQ